MKVNKLMLICLITTQFRTNFHLKSTQNRSIKLPFSQKPTKEVKRKILVIKCMKKEKDEDENFT